jgi:hypothetical protein
MNITPPCTNASCGYNTTSGGAQFLLLFGGTATFSFGAGIDAFGAYLTGVQNGGETITFSDGTSESVAIPNPGFRGGTAFVGFMDTGKSIASITINVNNDIVSVDDVRYIASVPEPASLFRAMRALAQSTIRGSRRSLHRQSLPQSGSRADRCRTLRNRGRAREPGRSCRGYVRELKLNQKY